MVRDPVDKKLKISKISLLMKQPFFGTLIMFLKFEDATDSGWCPTAAVDGKKIYYNREFINDLDQDEVTFVLCHEVLHVVLDHFGRRSHRDPSWWNMANDFVINSMLTEEGIGKMPSRKFADPNAKDGKGAAGQRVGLYDAKYKGWTSEAVYEDLEKRKVKKELTLDVHIELGNDKKSDSNNNIPIPVSMSAEELKDLKSELKNRIVQAATASAGKYPAGLKRIIGDLLDPKIDWRELLQQNIQACITDDFDFMRPNRRYQNSGIFLPSLKKDETVDLAIAIDLSGSISEEMGRNMLSEVYGIASMYNEFTIRVITFDTRAYNPKTFTKENIDDLLTYDLTGGGGTDFMAFWNYWIENDIEPKKAVIFTDGYCSLSGPNNGWGPSNYCDTLWIIVDTKVQPPFGQYAYYNSDDGVQEVGQS